MQPTLSDIKLIIFDLAGTLIDNHLNFKAEDLDRIFKLRKNEIKVTVATGRTFSSALPYIKRLNIDIPVITCNGAEIIHLETKEALFEKRIPKEAFLEAVLTAQNSNLEPVFYVDSLHGAPCIFKKTDKITAFLNREGLTDVTVYSSNKVMDTMLPPIKLQIVGKSGNLKEYMDNLDSLVRDINMVMTKSNYLEILPQNTSKGSAARFICSLLNIPLKNTLSFGDSSNDKELLLDCGIGVALAEAPEKLKVAADFTTDSIHTVLDILLESLS